MASGARCGGSGRRLTSAIAVGIGESSDPALVLRLQLFDAWREAWLGFGEQERRLVALAWRAAMPVVARAQSAGRWKTVQGTMTAVIATVLDMAWAPATPTM